MSQLTQVLGGPRAKATFRVERAYDYDEKRGVWMRRLEDEQEAYNLVTDAGLVRIHTYAYGSAGQRSGLGGGFNYIGLTNNGTAPAAGDTTLAAEITNAGAAGLGRALAAVTLATGSGNVTTMQKVFTYTGGGSQSVQKTALFDASTSGTMAHEIQFSARTLFTNDTLTVSYSITLG
jgi:hypothetical protein